MQKITPFLWFDNNCEEAVNFYLSVFKESKLISMNKYGGGPMEGKVMGAEFELFGLEFKAFDAGPHDKFNDSISMFVSCDNQEEIDYYWNALTAGGEESRCGWLNDKFGIRWQIVPSVLGELLGDKDPEKAGRALQAMLKMSKLDINELKKARDGE